MILADKLQRRITEQTYIVWAKGEVTSLSRTSRGSRHIVEFCLICYTTLYSIASSQVHIITGVAVEQQRRQQKVSTKFASSDSKSRIIEDDVRA